MLLLGLSGVAQAQASQDPTGEWVLNLGKKTLMVLSLRSGKTKEQPFSGTLSHPQRFQTGDSTSFSHIEGPIEVEPIVASHWNGRLLSITVQNPRDAADKDTFLLSLKDESHAELQWDGVSLPPLKFVRAKGDAAVFTVWESGRTYSPDEDAPSNQEMKRIFDEDQRVRQSYPNVDWKAVNQSDAVRRQETMKLLQDGALHSGEDFSWAAFVFQHGSEPNDYLLAHTLAMVAVGKGNSDALWIASATLDRYLQSIKQPQIYGTQFLTPKDSPTTQNPYNRTLIPDSLRLQLGVPSLAAQDTQRQQYDSQRNLAK